ncbi:MAG: hypothetical protein ACTSSN_03415 [Candidatus Heimdallarchaeaceae archaeon]
MSLEKAIEEIKTMFWGVLKGKFNPEEEEDVKTHLITNLATLSSYVKTCLPPDQQKEYEKHFSTAKDILLKFDSAGPWFRELPEMIDTVYNVITYANMLQIEYHRFSGAENDTLQFINAKLETLELNINSIREETKKLKQQTAALLQLQRSNIQITEIEPSKQIPIKRNEEKNQVDSDVQVFEELIEAETEKPEIEEIKEQEIIEEVELESVPVGSDSLDDISETTEKREKDLMDDAKDLIEGIEIASQYEFEQEPFVQNIETEQEALKELAGLLSALDPGDDSVISPLTEKLISISDEEGEIKLPSTPSIEESVISEEGLSEKEIAEVHEFRSSISRLNRVLSSTQQRETAADFVSSIKETIAHVSKEKDFEAEEEKSALTKIIEAEAGETDKTPIQFEDIENVIKHLGTRRQKAIERIQQLEHALNSEKIDEEEWQELRIKAERHMLRVEDTLDGYKRYLAKLQSQSN